MLPIDIIRRVNVESPKPTRVRPERRHVARYIGKAGTVEEERRRSLKSKLGEKSRDKAFRKIAAKQQRHKKSFAVSSVKVEQSASPQETSSENACGTNRRPSLSSAPSFSAVSALHRPRAGEKPR